MSVRITEDMMSDILEWLPSKSLMRFKSVHRSWDALFKTNYFIIKQRQRQKEKKGSNYDERFMIFNGHLGEEIPVDITMLSCNDPTTPLQEVHFPISQPGQPYEILHRGYCNGVFCLVAYFDFDIFMVTTLSVHVEEAIVWNPATREAKVLPPPPPYPDHIETKLPPSLLFGLGATSADDVFFSDLNYIQIVMSCHKTISVTPPPRDPESCYSGFSGPYLTGDYSVAFARVFNVSSNSWTVINFSDDANVKGIGFDHGEGGNNFEECGIYSNGVCHWLKRLSYVLCFDFRSNKLRKVDTPSPTTTLVEADRIFESRDSIAYVAYGMDNFQVEVWILKQEEKDCSSWTKLCTMEALSDPRIFAILKDDTEFLGMLGYNKTLVTYNSRAEPLLSFDTFTVGYPFSFYKYMESMIPLSL